MYGYAGSILVCDLENKSSFLIPTAEYSGDFLGGRGIAARLYWEMAPHTLNALAPENPLIVMTGPFAGFSGLAGSRWQICGKSPAIDPEIFSYSNLGGGWGATLKFAGFDGLVLRGAATKPTYLLIYDGGCEYFDAEEFWGMGAVEARDKLVSRLGRKFKVLVTGPAGEKQVPFATLLSEDDASASSGFGAVMGSKNVKAIAVSGKAQTTAADPARLDELTTTIRRWKQDELQEPPVVAPEIQASIKACYGCTVGCSRALLKTPDGQQGKYLCTAGFFYEDWAQQYHGKLTDVPFKTTRLCDDCGLDINVIYTMIPWLALCHRAGIISERNTGLPLSCIGSLEFSTTLTKMISRREGFGDLLAGGIFRAASELGDDAVEMIPDYVFHDGSYSAYDPRVYLANAMVFACEPRQSFPLTGDTGRTVLRWLDWVNNKSQKGNNAERSYIPAGREINDENLRFIAKHFWGSEQAADFTTTEGKALAAKMIQERHEVKESLILCNFSWHITSLEILRPQIIAEALTAITGQLHDERSIYHLGERIFNLRRAIHLREWDGLRELDTLPEVWYHEPVKESFMNPKIMVRGKDGNTTTRAGATLDKDEVASMRQEYYNLRGWDSNGLPTKTKLEALGLEDITRELESDGRVTT